MKSGKFIWASALAIVVVLVVGIWSVWRWIETTPRQSTQNSTAAADAHEAFGAVYEASWRGDEGIGEATMSATLLTPGLKTLMVNDPQRGSLDTQVVETFDAETKDQIAVIVAMDAVAGSASARLPDDTVRAALTFTVDETEAEMAELVPLVVTDLPTSNSNPTIQRRWVAFFTPSSKVDWGSDRPMKLSVADIGGVATRTFTWSTPAMLNRLAS